MGFSGDVWGTGDVQVQWCGSSVEMWVMWVPGSSDDVGCSGDGGCNGDVG